MHYATTDSDSESFHLTIGLHRDNMQWLDVMHHLLVAGGEHRGDEQSVAAMARGEGSGEGEGGGAGSELRAQLELMQIYSETAEGVHLHEAVPGWMLLCRRAWYGRETPPELRADRPASGADCEDWDAELARLYAGHLARFGDWLLRQSQAGPWRLASGLSEREKPLGEMADLDALGHLFWV